MTPYTVEQLTPTIRRIVCNNPSPFTYKGTNCYIVGKGKVAIIDPGPTDPRMIEAIHKATKDEEIAGVLITHTHKDHSPNAQFLSAKTYGYGAHKASRELSLGEINILDSSGDKDFVPDFYLKDGEVFTITGLEFEALFTPGHCANHLCFAYKNENILFSGDHVMGWSTSIVAPPDGAMGDYMRSLEKLIGREETHYYAGHGEVIESPQKLVRGMLGHRKMREASILEQVRGGLSNIPAIVDVIYKNLDPKLIGAASLSTYAHLEELVAKGLVTCNEPPQLGSEYFSRL